MTVGNRPSARGVLRAMSRPIPIRARSIAVAAAILAVAACGAGAPGPSGSVSPSGAVSPAAPVSPSATLPPDAILHPTGSADIVLRYDVGGGFVPIDFVVAHVPQLTLYGDGRVVYVNAAASGASTADGIATGARLRTAVLTESQVQALLVYALRDGGLGLARPSYDNANVADAPTTTFEIHFDGGSKTVSIAALGIAEGGPDAAIRSAFAKLADRLGDFDRGGTLGGVTFEPVAYRAMLLDASGARPVAIRAWPWTDLRPADFVVPSGASGPAQRVHVLTPDQARALGVTGFEGGIVGGLFLRLPDGTIDSLVVRPLLPDERS